MVLDKRRSHLFRHIAVARHRGLEIGPYLQPTVRKDEGDVRYLDFYSTEELAAFEQDRRPKGTVIPTVDYVVKSDDYWRYVPDRFDYLIANHVIEHVDNPVQWVIDLARLLHPGGVLFLTVPDKKYNFDRYRADTTLSHLLADYFRGHGDHREHGVDIGLCYDTSYVGKPMNLDETLDLARLRAAFDEQTHPGRHNHVFQSETFVPRILRPLQKLGLWQYELLEFGPAPDNHGEFYVVLRLGTERVDVTLRDVYGPAAEAATVVIPTPGTAVAPSVGVPSELAAPAPELVQAELLQLRADLATARREVQDLRRSLSWRLTGPIRSLLRAFH